MTGRIFTFMTLIGKISISEDGCGNIDGVFLPNYNLPVLEDEETEIIAEAEGQMDEYLSGRRKDFNLPLAFSGTEVQESVWNELKEIPYGETRTYAQIADACGRPKAYRAIGSACKSNPLPIIIPCHRIIPSSGGIGEYAGGSAFKRRLLEIEGRML